MNFVRAVGVLSVTAAVVSSLVGVTTVPVAVPAAEPTSAFIVELAPGETALDVSSEVAEDLNTDIQIDETFDTLLDGFSAELTPSEVEALQASPDVLAVYPDLPVSANATQANAPWNLSRLDQDTAPADSTYIYPDSAGSGARIYVVDTGVSANPAQFGSRLLPGFTAISDGNGTADCNGHGTHVAGTVASATYGVAKQASIVPVRVFGCTGSALTASVLAGLDWIAANHPAGTPGIVNLSLGSADPVTTTTDPLTTAVNTMSDRGFVMVVAAGNSNANACTYSPARAAKALTVAATTSTDARSGFSNFGACVDLFAPGSGIESLRWNIPSGSAVMSGTSMAAPHVAGVAALVWGEDFSRTARAVEARISSDSAVGVVSDPAGSPNQLLRVAPVVSAPPAPQAPQAPAPAPAPVASPAFRFWSDTYQSHFYTLSVAERNFVDAAYPDNVWRYEGPVFGAFANPVAGSIPVYRFWSSSYNAHFYTASENEKNHVIAAYPDNVWKYESIAYYAYPAARTGSDTQLMARFWSPTYVNHFFTASAGEAASVRRNFPPHIWTFEGNVFRVPTTYSAAPPLP
jgi:subtilisin family serine protease